jgi:primosomal protein N' (replication factor Y)
MENRQYSAYAQVYPDIQTARLNKPFTYGVPPDLSKSIYIGGMVKVPFNNRVVLGYVSDLSPFPPSMPGNVTIKAVEEAVEGASLWDREMLGLARWMEEYYACSFLSALKVLVPAPVRPDSSGKTAVSRVRKVLLQKDPADENALPSRLTPPQERLLRELGRGQGARAAPELLKRAGVSDAVLKALEKKGYLKIFFDAPDSKYFHNYPVAATGTLALTQDQQEVMGSLLHLSGQGKAAVALLHGITGSGKTEIYLQMVEKIIQEGREALVLVPEISLTPQAIQRFRDRFAESIAVLHSRLTDGERRQMWWKIKNKEVRVVLGARSAVFAPLENIGIIVVDEEHESSYKQESDPRYHARQVAVKRAMHHNALVILGSATPSLEVFHWAEKGQYQYLSLPRRIGASVLPEIEVVDLKKDLPADRSRAIIGETLKGELKLVLAQDQQAILFMNRRGFSAFILCRECGNVIRCPYCDITLKFHKAEKAIKCHYCDYRREAPDVCPICRGVKIEPVSAGIQRVEEELLQLFPDISHIRMDRDTTSGRDAHYQLLSRFARKEASVLIGTQMVAKGLDFPGVTLVGVILADVSLYLPDFRSLERTYQVLTQVAGRAGRRDRVGKVIIQTFNPDSPVIQSVMKQDYREFFQWESGNRQKLNYPPFAHLINLLFTGDSDDRVREYALSLADGLRSRKLKSHFIAVLGPAPCVLSRIKSRYRWHVTLKGKKVKQMAAVVKAVAERLPPPAGVAFSVDVDPLSML